MNEDFVDLLRELTAAKARFLVVGAHALAAHGVPRATGDLDIWVQRSPINATRVWAAIASFGAPMAALDFDASDLLKPELVWQLGVPPKRIDILTAIDGVSFDDAYEARVSVEVSGLEIPFLGREALLTNKAATGRAKDRLDLELLNSATRRE